MWGIQQFFITRHPDLFVDRKGNSYNKYVLSKHKPILVKNQAGQIIATNLKLNDKGDVMKSDFFWWIDTRGLFDDIDEIDGSVYMNVHRVWANTFSKSNGEVMTYVNVAAEPVGIPLRTED